MPSKATAFVFAASVSAATVIAWLLADFSFEKSVAFFLSMLFGGSLYFLWKGRE